MEGNSPLDLYKLYKLINIIYKCSYQGGRGIVIVNVLICVFRALELYMCMLFLCSILLEGVSILIFFLSRGYVLTDLQV